MMQMKEKSRSRFFKETAVNFGAIALIFAVIMALISANVITRFYESMIILICINVILAVSLNITTGFLGQIALGHAGFMAIGAYTAAIFVKSIDAIPGTPKFFIALLLGGIMAAIFGVIVGVPALRLKGDYLAIITLGFGEIIRVIIQNLEFTGGSQGLNGIPNLSKLPLVFWVTVIVVAILFAFVRSRHGRAITAIREDGIASEASGINITNYKVLAFTVAAFFGGIAGAVYSMQYRIINANNFGFMKSIDILVFVVLGGMGSITGSIVAAVVLTVLPEVLRDFSDYRMLVYSIVLILVMIFKPSGMLGRYEFSLIGSAKWLAGKLKGKKADKKA